jgi:hypothetical protein
MEDLGELFRQSFDVLWAIFLLAYPILLPFILFLIFSKLWITYVRAKFISNIKTVLLEIRVPKSVKHTPLAMEVALNAMFQTSGESTWYDRIVLGQVRSWFSLELVSIGGRVHFFIWTPTRWRNLIEAHLYAQYPGIEIIEVPDYALTVPFDESKMSYFGTEFVLSKPDYIPLKTYVDYGLDKQAGLEDEDKLDPLMTTIEFMSTLSPREQFWLQIVIRAHRNRLKPGGFFWWQSEKWQDTGKEFIKETSKKSAVVGSDGKVSSSPLSKSDTNLIEAVDRNISKPGFDTGIRAIYMGEKDAFNSSNISGFIGAYKQFGANNLNSLKPNNTTSFDFPWQQALWKHKLSQKKEDMLDAYKRRMFFHAPHVSTYQVLNSEQLATLFHFPPGLVESPAFERIQSRKAEPPVNLPT